VAETLLVSDTSERGFVYKCLGVDITTDKWLKYQKIYI